MSQAKTVRVVLKNHAVLVITPTADHRVVEWFLSSKA